MCRQERGWARCAGACTGGIASVAASDEGMHDRGAWLCIASVAASDEGMHDRKH